MSEGGLKVCMRWGSGRVCVMEGGRSEEELDGCEIVREGEW